VTIGAMLDEAIALIAPPRCGLCGQRCGARAPLCSGCQRRLAALPSTTITVPGLDAVWSAAAYEDEARRLVAALKFGSRLPLARSAAALIAQRVPAALLTGSIVPVPAAPARRRARGFDAAEEIAAALAAATTLPFERCLARSHGRRQVGRPRVERLTDPPRVRLASRAPEGAVLVDDVVTTGATLASCAKALRGGGSAWVVALTFARSRGLESP
jgi:ComF family protein